MATLTSRLIVAITDRVTGPARGIGGALARLRRQGDRTTGALFGRVGVGSAVRNLAILGAGYVGVREGLDATYKAAVSQQSALTEIGIKAGVSGKQLENLGISMRTLSGDVNQTRMELIGGIDTMVTLGLDANRAAAAMPAIGKAATATMSSVTDLAAASTAAMQNMSLLPTEIGKMMEEMAYAGNQGAFEVRDMARYFPSLTAQASNLGIKGVKGIADISAALEIARQGAGTAEEAFTNFQSFMQHLTTPDTIKNFKKFGVSVTKELQKANKEGVSPIEHFIKIINKVTKGGRQDLLSQLFGRQQANLFILPMLKHFQEYLQMRNGAIGANGLIDTQFTQRMQNAEEKVKSFKIQVQNLGEAIGETALKPVGDFAGELAQTLKTLDKRVGVFDKLKTSVSGLLAGFGIKAPGDTKNWLDSIFGTEFDNDKGYDNDPRVTALARLSNKMRGIGRNFRAFVDDISAGNVSAAMHDLGTGLKEMSGSMTVGGAIAIGAVGYSLMLLGKGAVALTFSKAGQIAMVAWAVATLIDAAQGANSIGEFADNLSKLSKFDWIVMAGGIGLVGAKVWRLARGLGLIKQAGGMKTIAEGAPKAAAPTGGFLATVGRWATTLGAALLGGVAAGSVNAVEGGAGQTEAEKERNRRNRIGAASYFNNLPSEPAGGASWWMRLLLGAAADPGFNFRDQMGMSVGGMAGGSKGPSDVSVGGVPEVSIPGPITTQPSGTQDVRVTNPMPAPVVNITVNAKADATPAELAGQIKNEFSKMLDGLSRGAYSDGAN